MKAIIFYKHGNETAKSLAEKIQKAKPGDCIPLTEQEMKVLDSPDIIFNSDIEGLM